MKRRLGLLFCLVMGAMLMSSQIWAGAPQESPGGSKTFLRAPDRQGPNFCCIGKWEEKFSIGDSSNPSFLFPASMSEGFEGTWPSSGWRVSDQSSTDGGEYLMGKRDCHPRSGSYAGWTVGGGADGGRLACNSNYPNNARSWAVYGPFSLQGYSSATLVFYLYGISEYVSDQCPNDFLFVGSSVNGTDFQGGRVCGNATGGPDGNGYYRLTFDLDDRLGQPQVWVAFLFFSNSSTVYNGFTIDDISIQLSGGPGATPTFTPTVIRTATATATRTRTPTPTHTTQPGTITLISVGDTTVLEAYPSMNAGATTDMWVGYDEQPESMARTVRSLVRFNLASIPSGATINSARLRVYLIASYDYPNRRRRVTAYRPTADWSETTVTWSNAPGFAEAYGGVDVLHGGWGWYEIDVTNLVRAWMAGTYPNYGIMLRGPEVSGDESSVRMFFTREGDYPPQLVVDYAGATPSNTPTRTATATPTRTATTGVSPTPTRTHTPTGVPQTEEWKYDDGVRERGAIATDPGYAMEVRFNAVERRQVLQLRYYVYHLGNPVRMYLRDGSGERYSREVTPSVSGGEGWFDWDISGEQIFVQGPFSVGFESRAGGGPALGRDETAPIDGHSYQGPVGNLQQITDADFMIRVVVSGRVPVMAVYLPIILKGYVIPSGPTATATVQPTYAPTSTPTPTGSLGPCSVRLYLNWIDGQKILSRDPVPPNTSIRTYFGPGVSSDWPINLTGDLGGNSYGFSLLLASLSSTTFQASIIWKRGQQETTLASATFTVTNTTRYERFDRDVRGIDPETASGDTLILRITHAEGASGSVLYGPPNIDSYILVPCY